MLLSSLASQQFDAEYSANISLTCVKPGFFNLISLWLMIITELLSSFLDVSITTQMITMIIITLI